jgi:poly-gamma-glutamate system protein
MKRYRLKTTYAPVYAAAVVSLAYVILVLCGPGRPASIRKEMIEAAGLMARAEAAIRDCRARSGFPVDENSDPNRTGLIGLETSPITTSLGNLAAKRTSTNPNFAGLAARLFYEAGARKGDVVAVGASGSFPALIIATLSAAKVMGLRPLVISSLGASEWGANIPGFNWLDMEECLRSSGVLDVRPIALAMGGDEDMGGDMASEGRDLLRTRIKESGVPFLENSNLRANVEERLKLYGEAAGGRPFKAFINVGGSWANIGTNPEVLKLQPGLVRNIIVPPLEERGVLQAMAARKIPVIHLLNLRGLAERYGLPWDPKPLPGPGEGGFYAPTFGRGALVPAASGAYLLLIILIMLQARRRRAVPAATRDGQATIRK